MCHFFILFQTPIFIIILQVTETFKKIKCKQIMKYYQISINHEILSDQYQFFYMDD